MSAKLPGENFVSNKMSNRKAFLYGSGTTPKQWMLDLLFHFWPLRRRFHRNVYCAPTRLGPTIYVSMTTLVVLFALPVCDDGLGRLAYIRAHIGPKEMGRISKGIFTQLRGKPTELTMEGKWWAGNKNIKQRLRVTDLAPSPAIKSSSTPWHKGPIMLSTIHYLSHVL